MYKYANFSSFPSCLHVLSNITDTSLHLLSYFQFRVDLIFFSFGALSHKVTSSNDLRNLIRAASVLSFFHITQVSVQKH
jgi:hypothetical protein